MPSPGTVLTEEELRERSLSGEPPPATSIRFPNTHEAWATYMELARRLRLANAAKSDAGARASFNNLLTRALVRGTRETFPSDDLDFPVGYLDGVDDRLEGLWGRLSMFYHAHGNEMRADLPRAEDITQDQRFELLSLLNGDFKGWMTEALGLLGDARRILSQYVSYSSATVREALRDSLSTLPMLYSEEVVSTIVGLSQRASHSWTKFRAVEVKVEGRSVVFDLVPTEGGEATRFKSVEFEDSSETTLHVEVSGLFSDENLEARICE